MNTAQIAEAERISDKVNAPGYVMDSETKTVLTSQDIAAEYKLQINFGPGRTNRGEFNALMTFWASGKFFHGGGDDQMYVCLNRLLFADTRNPINPKDSYKVYLGVLNKKLEGNGCGQMIPSSHIKNGTAFCSTCQKGIIASNLVNMIYFRGTVKDLAVATANIFRLGLSSNADIYCKYDPSDVRYVTMQRDKGSEEAHRLRGLLIYPLGRIIKDLSSGSALDTRFTALFSA